MSAKVEKKEVKTEKKEKKQTKTDKPKAKRVKKVKSESETTEKKERKRRDVTKDSVNTDFEALEEKLASEIETLRDSKDKVKGIKFLRSINKLVKVLHKDYNRVLKIKKVRKTGESNTSGFKKPVKIREELAKFTGWDVNGSYSRVDVTRFICNYIKEHNLQNPEDRRLIVPDEKLCKVLNFDPKTVQEPLTYFRIQQYIQWQFVKEEKKEEVKKEKNEEKKKEVVKEEPKEEKKPKAKAKVAKKKE